jgi:hypothetical protein
LIAVNREKRGTWERGYRARPYQEWGTERDGKVKVLVALGGKGGERDQESHEAKSRRVETGRRKSILYGAPSLQVKGDFIYICVLTRFNTSQQELLIVMNRVKVDWNETTGKRRKRGGACDDPKARGDRARQRAIKPLCRGAIACRLLRALEFLDCELCDV